MEIAGIAVFVAAGLLILSLLTKNADTRRHIRFVAAGCLLAAAVWVVIVMVPRLL